MNLRPAPILLAGFLTLLAAGASPAPSATITVDTIDDSDVDDGFCTLREAIFAANLDAPRNGCPGGTGADRIVFALPAPQSIVLFSDLPPVTDTVAIRGPGAADLSIFGSGIYRLFQLSSGVGGKWFLIEGLKLTRGFANSGTPIDGGALYVGPGETALIRSVDLADNQAQNGGGGAAVEASSPFFPTRVRFEACNFIGNLANGATGGAGLLVHDGAEVEVDRSTFEQNTAMGEFGSGGGIRVSRSILELTRSTVSGNRANSGGGGIAIDSNTLASVVTIVDSTIYDNECELNVDGIGDGGGIFISGSLAFDAELTLENSIVAGNVDAGGPLVYDDVYFESLAVLAASSHNLIGRNEGASAQFPAGLPNVAGDFAGTGAAPLDPLLEPLADNNGPTRSHRPILDAASPVIDHGSCPGSLGDQRLRGDSATGLRAFDIDMVPTHAASDGCDIGSVERGGQVLTSSDLFDDGFELGHTLLWNEEAP